MKIFLLTVALVFTDALADDALKDHHKCDSVTNLTQIPNKAKSCKEDWCKDRYERKIYGGMIDSDHCTFVVIK